MVFMGPEVIINNAFFAKRNEELAFLDFSALRSFCNILYDKITGGNGRGKGYKYVCFQVDEMDVEEFCDANIQFVRGIDKVFCMGKIEEEDLKIINSIYEPEIQTMLKDAREVFAAR